MSGPGAERWAWGSGGGGPAVLGSGCPSFPAPGGPGGGGARRVPAPRRSWGPGPGGPGGVGRGREAERGPTQAAAAGSGPYGPGGGWRRKPGGWRRRGGGGGRGWSAARRRLTSPAQQGKVPRARSRPPAPGPPAPRPPVLARAGRSCGRHGRVRGPERPRGLRRPRAAAASAALGREGWGALCRGGSRTAVGAAPPSLASGEAVVRPGGVIPGRGLRRPGQRTGVQGRRDPRSCVRQGSARGARRARSVGTDKAGRRRPAATRAVQGVGAGERREGAGATAGTPGEAGQPALLRLSGWSRGGGGRRAGWGAALSEGPTGEPGWETGRVY